MTNNSVQVFKGGWEELQNAKFTDNHATGLTTPESFFIKPDGTILFVLNTTNNSIEEYQLSTPWDISTRGALQNTFLITENPQTVGFYFKFDGTKLYILDSTIKTFYEYTILTPWDISSVVDSLQFISTTPEDTNPFGVIISQNGTKMYTSGNQNNRVYEYTLSVPFDVISAVFVDFSPVIIEDDTIQGISISPDGTKFYIVGNQFKRVYEYTLTISFDITSITFVNFINIPQDPNLMGLSMSDNGTKMYIIGTSARNCLNYTLNTPFDITSTVFVNSFTVVVDFNIRGIIISQNGTKMYVTGGQTDVLLEYTLSVPFDVTSAVLVNSFSVGEQAISPRGISISPDGTKLYMIGGVVQEIIEYTLFTPFDVTSIFLILTTSITAVIDNATACVFSQKGDFFFITGGTFVYSFPLPILWDITSNVTSSLFPVISFIPTGIVFKPQGDEMYLSDGIAKTVTKYTLLFPYNIASAAPTGDIFDTSFDLNGLFFRGDGRDLFILHSTDIIKYYLDTPWIVQTASHFTNQFMPTGFLLFMISWKHDGTKFFILDGIGSEDITEYTAESPWNISSAVEGSTFSLASGFDTNIQAMWWKPDGTRCYIVGAFNNIIYQLDLPTPWEISTMVDSGIEYDGTGEFAVAGGIYFRADGKKMYVGTQSTDEIHEYDLSPAWDIATATHLGFTDFSSDIANLQCILFRPDGKILYIGDATNDSIVRFRLTTPWDLTTAVFQDSLDISSFDMVLRGIFIRENDGKKLFILGTDNDTVFSFDMSSEFNNSIITEDGDELTTELGEELVYA